MKSIFTVLVNTAETVNLLFASSKFNEISVRIRAHVCEYGCKSVNNEVKFPTRNCYFTAVSTCAQWERPVWFWLPPALCPVCVCVGPLCPGLFHMCLTLL